MTDPRMKRTSQRPIRRALALALAALLSACAVGPNFVRPKAPELAGYTGVDAEAPRSAGPKDATQRIRAVETVTPAWWRAFNSPPLDATVELALTGSPTLDGARATLAQASALTAAARGAYYPQADVKASLAHVQGPGLPGGGFGPAGNVLSVGPLVSFDTDLFGRNARSVEQQAALAEVQRYQLAAAYLSLTGNAVTQVLTVASIRAEIAAVDEIVAVDQRNLELVQIAFQAGRSAQLDVLSAQSQLASDQTLLPPLRQQLSTARNALAVLVGKAPSQWAAPDLDLGGIALPEELPLTLPSALVRQRPDILTAEAQLHAASAGIGVATAQLYPNVSLSAAWTQQSGAVGTLFDPASAAWNVGASLAAPLFHGGTLEAQRRAAVEAYNAELAVYRQTILQSFGQVADVLRALEHDAELIAADRRALDIAEASLKLTQDSFAAGQASFLQVLVAQRLFQEAQLGYVRARAQRYLDTAQLYVALGGAAIDWKGELTAGAR